MRILALFGVMLTAALAAAQPRRAMTFDDFIRLRRVSDPQLSPDGRQVAFVVTTFDLAANQNNDDIWVVDVAGGAPRRLTTSEKSDLAPSWSPDGRRLAFLSSRDGAPQVYVLPLAGGEARRVTDRPSGVSARPVWSRDGKWLAFAAPAFPGCTDEACNRKQHAAVEQSKVKARLYDDLPVRMWDAWRDRTRSHLFVVDAAGRTPPRDLTPGAKDVPPIDLTGPADYDFSPDGREVAFTRVDEPPAWSTNADVYVVPRTGGKPRKLTTNPANDSYPRYSPDGRYLAFRAMTRPGYEADRRRLVLYDRRRGTLVNLTESLDRSVGDFAWSRDGTTLYFDAEDGGYRPVYAVPASGGALRTLVAHRFTHGFGVAPDGTVVYAAESAQRPPEVYRLAGGAEQALTHLNTAALGRLDLRPAEPFSYRGAKGDTIHGFLVKPPGFTPGRRYPLLVVVHGGPQGMMSDDWHWRWNYQMFAAKGYVVAAPNFHGSSGYGSAFQDAIRGDWGGAPFEDVMKAVDVLAARPFIDGRRVAAAGASYGGYLINWMAGHTNRRFRCLISHDGLYNLSSMNAATEELWFPEWEFHGTPFGNRPLHERFSPSSYGEKIETPMLVIHGEQDMRVPLEEALQLFGTLRRRGVPARLLVFPDEGHFVLKPQNAELWWRTMHEWLKRWL